MDPADGSRCDSADAFDAVCSHVLTWSGRGPAWSPLEGYSNADRFPTLPARLLFSAPAAGKFVPVRPCFPGVFYPKRLAVFSCALYRVIFPAVGENFPAAPSLLENPALFGPWRVLKHPPEGGGVPPAQGPSRAHILALGGIFFNRVPAFSPCCS